jgi:alkanesulfonate monooxygenase SsuD/methylene tetrahydromethanopterin reductase-like flavin-dependent oxidoreductase (luciferase family)
MTARPVTFGFTLPQRGMFFGVGTWPEMLDLARRVDGCELFDSLWVGDSLLAKPRPESLTLLGGLSTATRRVTLRVACMASFPVRDPLLFAYQWANLDLMSGGRMLLAACTGIIPGLSPQEGAQWGVTDAERGERMMENIDICRRLWSEDHVTFTGRFRAFSDVTLRPKPLQQPCPIWIASNPPPTANKVLRRAARRADGWMTVNVLPDLLAANWARLATFLKEADRDPEQYPTVAYHNVNVGPDRRAALEESKRFLDEYYGPVFAPPMVEAWTAAGPPARCIEDLRSLGRDGAKQIALRVTGWRQGEQFERLVNEVLPCV